MASPNSESFELERAVLEREGGAAGRAAWFSGRRHEVRRAAVWRVSGGHPARWPTWTCWASADTCPRRYAVGEVSALRDLEARPSTRGAAAQKEVWGKRRHRRRPSVSAGPGQAGPGNPEAQVG